MPRIDHPMIQAMLKRAQEEATANPPPTAEELFAAEAEARPEAAARKQRSLATLAREGVPVNVHLPTIESEAEVRRRPNSTLTSSRNGTTHSTGLSDTRIGNGTR